MLRALAPAMFCRREEPRQRTHGVSLYQRLDPLYLDQIRADSNDHIRNRLSIVRLRIRRAGRMEQRRHRLRIVAKGRRSLISSAPNLTIFRKEAS